MSWDFLLPCLITRGYDKLLGTCGYGDLKTRLLHTYILYILHISSKNHLESRSQVLPSRRSHQEFYAVISWLKHVKPWHMLNSWTINVRTLTMFFWKGDNVVTPAHFFCAIDIYTIINQLSYTNWEKKNKTAQIGTYPHGIRWYIIIYI